MHRSLVGGTQIREPFAGPTGAAEEVAEARAHMQYIDLPAEQSCSHSVARTIVAFGCWILLREELSLSQIIVETRQMRVRIAIDAHRGANGLRVKGLRLRVVTELLVYPGQHNQ